MSSVNSSHLKGLVSFAGERGFSFEMVKYDDGEVLSGGEGDLSYFCSVSDLIEMLSTHGEIESLAGGSPRTGDGSLEWGEWVKEDAFGVAGDLSVSSAMACGISVNWHGVVTEGVD